MAPRQRQRTRRPPTGNRPQRRANAHGGRGCVRPDTDTLGVVPIQGDLTRGQCLVIRMRGRAASAMSTDQLMDLLRGEDEVVTADSGMAQTVTPMRPGWL